MQLQDAEYLAYALIDQHLTRGGLVGWTYQQDHARQRCGACHFDRKQISLSKHFIELNSPAEVRRTLLHEIAHALCGPGEGHGPAWRRTALKIDAPVEATNDRAVMPLPRWALVCKNCAQTVARRHRRSLNLDHVRCRVCGVHKGMLEWQDLNEI